jgi:tripartite-type tricarboxylate transporter receptor subunit TctC
LLAALASPFAANAVNAADYPAKPIRLVVPFAPGSLTDGVARVLAEELTRELGHAVIVDDKPGGSGIIAAESVARGAADGYTLFVTTNTTHSANPSLFKKLPYDPVRDFVPIAQIGWVTFALVVAPTLPVNTAAELVTHARANPGQLSYATANASSRVYGATLANLIQVDMIEVPFKSSPQAIAEIVSGRVSLGFADLFTSAPQIRAKKVRALAIASNRRSRLMPELATMQEVGWSGFDLVSWVGLFAPAGTPEPIVQRLVLACQRALTRPGMRERIAGAGIDLAYGDHEALRKLVAEQLLVWSRRIRAAKIEPE